MEAEVGSDSKIRALVWDSMLSADLSYRYFCELGAKFRSRDRAAKIFLAITSSAADP